MIYAVCIPRRHPLELNPNKAVAKGSYKAFAAARELARKNPGTLYQVKARRRGEDWAVIGTVCFKTVQNGGNPLGALEEIHLAVR